jgi:hypothetical protein
MGKISAVGLLALVSGLFMIVFKAISVATSVSLTFPDLTLDAVLDPSKLEWIDDISINFIQNIADAVVTTPLYIGCIILGVVLLLIGGLMGK